MDNTYRQIKPKFRKKTNPKIGLITLSTDLTMEKDFYSVCNNLPLDVFVNRIHNYNPLTKKNLLKMYGQLYSVAKKILPGKKINTMAYGCTSGTIAIGKKKIKNKIQLAKPGCYVTTPITSAVKAIRLMKIKKIAIFTPYPNSVNKSILEYFIKEKIKVLSFSSFNLKNDYEIAKIDPNYLLKVLSNLEFKKADAIFVSCTALPILEVISKLEKKINKTVISSNQALIWDTIRSVGCKSSIKGYGKLLRN